MKPTVKPIVKPTVKSSINYVLFPLLGALGLYLLGYAYARVVVFHSVEHYTGADGKGGQRQDYIAKVDHSPGEGWEYHLFLPVITIEESIVGYVNRNR